MVHGGSNSKLSRVSTLVGTTALPDKFAERIN